MVCLKSVLPPKLFEIVEKANINTSKQILVFSVWDLQRITNLHMDDVILLKNLIANFVKPKILTANLLTNEDQSKNRITSGCDVLNRILGGGFRRGCITEIFGESGSGKTQLGIQALVHNWPDCCIYICTEDLFPIKRFVNVKKSIPNYSPDVDYGKNIYVEHITESNDLMSCVNVRVPKLLSQKKGSFICIDSIAAPFRVNNTNYIQRAEELRALAISLILTSQKYNLAVICINQVTASFENTAEVLPSLGLAWSNMVSTRLCLRKTSETICISNSEELEEKISNEKKLFIRELSVSFAPDLPEASAKFVITPTGVQGLL